MNIEHSSRITIILHPNPKCIDIILNDKFFNKETYSYSRDKKPTGNEERMLKRLMNIFAIDEARTHRNVLSLRIQECFYHVEFIPLVVEIVKEFTGPDFAQAVYLDDRREKIASRYNEDGDMISRGTKIVGADIGIPYFTYDSNNAVM
jgi:hypothetical protein